VGFVKIHRYKDIENASERKVDALVAPEYEGHQLPVRDLLMALDWIIPQVCAKDAQEAWLELLKEAAGCRRGSSPLLIGLPHLELCICLANQFVPSQRRNLSTSLAGVKAKKDH
jgi:hypothetical protein